MSQWGETRTGLLNIIAACIIAGGLIGGALILTHRPSVIVTSPGMRGAVPAPTAMQPPITQASASAQLRAQVLAAPTLHMFVFKKATYTLVDVKVTQVIYEADKDTFMLYYANVWQPAMPPGGPQDDEAILTNDGYGHYYGFATVGVDNGEPFQHADVTLK